MLTQWSRASCSKDIPSRALQRYSQLQVYKKCLKKRNGTFAQRYVTNKIVPIHANPALKDRCHVRVLDLYYTKLPSDAMGKDVFYLSLFPKMPVKQGLPWFSSQLEEMSSTKRSRKQSAEIQSVWLAGITCA